jgi:hypothetical protein
VVTRDPPNMEALYIVIPKFVGLHSKQGSRLKMFQVESQDFCEIHVL